MKKFRKLPIVIETEQWFEVEKDKIGGNYRLEVGYFNHPDISGIKECKHCGKVMQVHGWIDTLEGGHTVCPGDWIIKGVNGEFYPCKPDIFEKTYEEVVE